MLRRRLTALLASLLFLPSALAAGGDGCVIGGFGTPSSETAMAGGHDAPPDHHSHAPHSVDLRGDTGTGSPAVPHAPAQCALAVGCVATAVAAAVIPIDSSVHVVARVEPDVVLAPDSPSLGLEPPPPRA